MCMCVHVSGGHCFKTYAKTEKIDIKYMTGKT